MFELEIINLLNNYKKSEDYDKIKIKKSICNLIKENESDFNKFISKDGLDDENKKFLNDCYKSILVKNIVKKDTSDFELVKEYYLKWLEIFNRNNKIPNEENEKIILAIINFYVLNRFEVLEEILEIQDSEDFDSFKSMLKNYLRKYFAEKISIYYKSENFKNLGFFEKRKKKNQILEILNEIGEYKFDVKKIKVAL